MLEIASNCPDGVPMQMTIEQSAILKKTRELCQTIVEQPEFATIREQVNSFLSDSEAQLQYQVLSHKGETLQGKQQQGVSLSEQEIAEFEREREAFFNNPVAKGFVDAQQAMHKVQESVSQHVSKTFELGRVPTEDDFEGSCGSGCGCH
jgi:cell fate (sporulation/competence/biofilm development) regulator YlbF (YheA/YmcA/DUF963 family)